MTDVSLGGGGTTADIQSAYMEMTHRKRMYGGILLVVFVALMASGFVVADGRNAGGFWNGITNVFDFPSEVVAEAAENGANIPGLMVNYLPSLIETLNIAAASTLIGALAAILLSLLSTRGLARWPRLTGLFRRMMDISRAVPEIVIALVLIFVLGGGPVPAMIAIAIHTAGALGKLFSEVNENASLKPVEGLESVGATWGQRMVLGVIPQVAPNYLSYALLRFEINIRASAILGFVGSGGIGYDLKNAFSWGQGRYDEVAAIFILLFLTIVAVDQISSHYRNRLTGSH
ncbi:phosphonate ABC transporter, permease protein PhnE [Lutimaribacter sp. EGI FJ00015]|uniref:Phosphonate ABC transporter, permease protein PhnE n=1 Tax=Lutimaribacter degradans TaxID=2945989 RepID=A0ACC5ZU56_9RHOB|nr:phosphonate ABC transporter, permease protein PhnE [Lutimaribacter sp. EGI FJ00013]MCM2561291.1 phosphonate ABC transporter, permease protein PhnE [Lutimaribacter sp. EGI FJ00013]MCO0611758.1 phosphonate ABC transporter, permease protein PhnE [Lutimaribacter sp. EGI FJ00015]MCO0635120.1 phosphonate ABC transporter, permease protein PhnE [Lutimaribacter sp. EGI FJ00014]